MDLPEGATGKAHDLPAGTATGEHDGKLADLSDDQGPNVSSSRIPSSVLAERTTVEDLPHNVGKLSVSASTSEPSQVAASSKSPLPPQEKTYLDLTPRAPLSSSPASRVKSNEDSLRHPIPEEDVPDMDELAQAPQQHLNAELYPLQVSHHHLQEDEVSSPEIQNIMDQFPKETSEPCVEANPWIPVEFPDHSPKHVVQHPPRLSSLEPVDISVTTSTLTQNQILNPTQYSPPTTTPPSRLSEEASPVVASEVAPIQVVGQVETPLGENSNPRRSFSGRPPSLQALPLPEPDPEPDLPFDFHRFLEQLRHKSADPVARFLRSFLVEFGKKQWMVNEQVKIISDFLAFITNKMVQCEVWQGVSEAEFDNAREGMEKLVMNRLYSQTFSPAIPPPRSVAVDKEKRRQVEKGSGSGRRGQHQEDIERDTVLAQKIRIYSWVREEHLDLQPVGESGRRFLNLAEQGNVRTFDVCGTVCLQLCRALKD